MRRGTRRGRRGRWKEHWKKRGGWRPGVGSRGWWRPEQTSRSSPPVGRWVVERGLPRLLSVSRTSGLRRPFFFLPSRSLSLSLFLSSFLRLCLALSLSSFPLALCPAPRSTLATLLFRDLVSAAAFLFFPPSDLHVLLPPALPPAPSCQPRPCFAALYARAFPASPALRSDRLRIHCEIDRPKRVPEWPERTRMQQKGMGWHMRSRRFKGTPQESDATAARCTATPLSSSVFFLAFPSGHHIAILVYPTHSPNGSETRILQREYPFAIIGVFQPLLPTPYS